MAQKRDTMLLAIVHSSQIVSMPQFLVKRNEQISGNQKNQIILLEECQWHNTHTRHASLKSVVSDKAQGGKYLALGWQNGPSR